MTRFPFTPDGPDGAHRPTARRMYGRLHEERLADLPCHDVTEEVTDRKDARRPTRENSFSRNYRHFLVSFLW